MWVAADPVTVLIFRIGLAGLFLFAAAHKLRDFAAFRGALSGYDLVPQRLIMAAAALLSGSELIVGVMLAWPGMGLWPVAAAGVLLGLYTGAIVAALWRGLRVDCGCAGPAGRVRLTWGLVARNLVLLGIVVAAGVASSDRPLSWLDGVTIGGGVVALALVYIAADTALANADRLHTPARSGEIEMSESEGLSWSVP